MKQNSTESLRYIKEAMSLIPKNTAAAMLVRHAERPGIIPGHHGNELLLTPQGEKDSFAAGELMRGKICGLLHSPIKRCQQTAAQMQKGSGASALPKMWRELKYHSYAKSPELAKKTLGRLGESGFYENFVKKMSESRMSIPYPGFKSPLIGAGDLVRHLLSRDDAGICVGVTHDWLVNVAVSYATGKVITYQQFAKYLDALFVWKVDNSWMFYYKGQHGKCANNFIDTLVQPTNT